MELFSLLTGVILEKIFELHLPLAVAHSKVPEEIEQIGP